MPRPTGGALSHHHGVGLNRGRFMAQALGPAFEVLAAVKAALDPDGVLNPGKLGLPSPFGDGPVAVGRPTWDELDHRAIWRGTRAYLIIAVPCGVLAAVAHRGGLQAVAVLLLLVGSFVGGAVAAATGDRAPLTQAAVAVTIPTVAFFVLRVLVGAARGDLDATPHRQPRPLPGDRGRARPPRRLSRLPAQDPNHLTL